MIARHVTRVTLYLRQILHGRRFHCLIYCAISAAQKPPETLHRYWFNPAAIRNFQLLRFRTIAKPHRNNFTLTISHLRQVPDRHIARSNRLINFLRVGDDLFSALQHHPLGWLDDPGEYRMRGMTCDATRIDDRLHLCKGDAPFSSCA